MMKKWKYLFLIFTCALFNATGNAQLSVQGLLHVQEGARLHVWNDVEITSATGLLENNGTIEVEGDWTKDADGQFNSNPSGSGERVVRFRNDDFNTAGNQRISGMMNADNAFYNLEIDNTGDERLVDLDGPIEITSNLNFYNGRIRTDIVSNAAGDGNAYANTVVVSNSNTNAITGQAIVAGVDKYIEGKLTRSVAGMGTYAFPVGISPDLLDGSEPFEVTFTTPAPLSNISSAFQLATTSADGQTRLCDIGIAPDYATPDGTLNQLVIDCVAGQWITESDATSYNFNIEFMVGDNFLNTCNDAVLYYVANEGDFDDCPDSSGSTGIVGMGMTNFGVFDIPTVADNSITTSLDVIGKDDRRIRIFPNPVSSQEPLLIDIAGDIFQGEFVTLEVFDAIGRLVLRDENIAPEGLHKIYLDQLSTGIFQIVLKNTKVIANRSVALKR